MTASEVESINQLLTEISRYMADVELECVNISEMMSPAAEYSARAMAVRTHKRYFDQMPKLMAFIRSLPEFSG